MAYIPLSLPYPFVPPRSGTASPSPVDEEASDGRSTREDNKRFTFQGGRDSRGITYEISKRARRSFVDRFTLKSSPSPKKYERSDLVERYL